MPKKRAKKSSKANRKVPPWGRSEKEISHEMGLHHFSADVPLGNNDPTVVQGVLEGTEMPNASRMARGRLKEQRGKRN